MSHTTGVSGRFFEAMGTASINVLAIAQVGALDVDSGTGRHGVEGVVQVFSFCACSAVSVHANPCARKRVYRYSGVAACTGLGSWRLCCSEEAIATSLRLVQACCSVPF